MAFGALLNSSVIRLFLSSPPIPTPKPRAMASWSCSICTYINSPSRKSACEMCLSPPSPLATTSSSSAAAAGRQWSCRACTFTNPFGTGACDICSTPAAPFSNLDDNVGLDADDVSDPSIGSVFWPLQPCGGTKRGPAGDAAGSRTEKAARKDEAGSHFQPLQQCSSQHVMVDDVIEPIMEKMQGKEIPSSVSEKLDSNSIRSTLKVLSYNVWFREDLELNKRMKALGDLIQQHTPDLICFQEVTPNIYEIFKNSTWWKAYTCSVSQKLATERAYFCMQVSKLPVESFSCNPFNNSIMGRELCLANVDVGMDKRLIVATSHLESPCPAPPRWDQMYSKERVAQAKQSLTLLNGMPNVIFCGDMNWDDKLDGPFPLPNGDEWVDAWMKLRPREDGWTYDTKANQMLSGNRKLQKRLDRFICNLMDFQISRIEMIGMEAIPGLSYCKEKKVRNEFQKLVLPVLPSDHYGLLLTISRLHD